MRQVFVLMIASCLVQPAMAKCTDIETDIVSLGEKAARYYAARSMATQIEDAKRLVTAHGGQVGKVTQPEYDCKFFPNIINMDEWRCTGKAKVCTR